MKSVRIELPDKLADDLRSLVRNGWFRDEAEALRQALQEFLRRHPSELIERQQREDIAWAMIQKRNDRETASLR